MLEKYRMIRRIGMGSFGEVFQVSLKASGQLFAMKKIPNIQGREQLFETEIMVMMKTVHPNIVSIIEYFYDEDHESKKFQRALYIVMEYCKDGDLFNYVAQRKKAGSGGPSEQDVISIIRQIVYGCIALNEKGILHRDLKPQNIMLDGPVVKIADFGCAKLFDVMNTYRYTTTSFNVGTPMYSAPELLNLEPYDDRCDVWSLGVLVYFITYATVPFLERDVKRLKAIIVEKTQGQMGCIQLPQTPQISQQLRDLIRGMLKYKQEQRLTWTQIISWRMFQKVVEYPSRFVHYLFEVVKVLGWAVQSLLMNFSSFYPKEHLSRFCHCVNMFLVGRQQLLCKILTKDPSVQAYFPVGRLEIHEFEVQLLQQAKKSNLRFQQYLRETTDICNRQVPLDEIVEKDRSDRYYLWRAEKKARKLMVEVYTAHKQNEQCLRSLYCLALVAGYDRLLGQHEYLKLNSNQLCSYIKHCPMEQLQERVSYQLSRVS